MSSFRPVDRDTGFLLSPSVDEWLPEKHLARFVVEVIDGLDLGRMAKTYRGSGSASYHPSMLLGILVYGYATGVFSSRKLERATYDSVAFRFIAANQHPDHDTIAVFRRRFLEEITELFVQVLELAREMGMLRMGTVALDGTKVHANASRHSALSYEHAGIRDPARCDRRGRDRTGEGHGEPDPRHARPIVAGRRWTGRRPRGTGRRRSGSPCAAKPAGATRRTVARCARRADGAGGSAAFGAIRYRRRDPGSGAARTP